MNPFELIYDRLWTLALTSNTISSLVKVGNRIRFDDNDNRDPLKGTVATADLPELSLLTEGQASANIHKTTCHVNVIRRYAFVIATGDMRLTEHLHKLEWGLFCALTNWKDTLFQLKWNDKLFVKRLDALDALHGTTDSLQNKGIKGWSAVWRCEVECYFPKELLIADLGN